MGKKNRNHLIIRLLRKSILLKQLVEQEKNKFDKIFCCCPTEQINRFYKDIVDEKCIYDGYNENWHEELISSLTKN